MRNYKFRGKVIENPLSEKMEINIGDWTYGNLIIADNGDCFITSWKRTEGVGYYSSTYQVDPETIGQYIDLDKDKCLESSEICEGDIVLCQGLKHVVVWHDSGFKLERKERIRNLGYGYKENTSWANVTEIPYGYPKELNIIGNIHDNPELI